MIGRAPTSPDESADGARSKSSRPSTRPTAGGDGRDQRNRAIESAARGRRNGPHGPCGDALSVIESGALEEYGVGKVSIAGYADRHPDISDTSGASTARQNALPYAGVLRATPDWITDYRKEG